jgi:hypothetical protein
LRETRGRASYFCARLLKTKRIAFLYLVALLLAKNTG